MTGESTCLVSRIGSGRRLFDQGAERLSLQGLSDRLVPPAKERGDVIAPPVGGDIVRET